MIPLAGFATVDILFNYFADSRVRQQRLRSPARYCATSVATPKISITWLMVSHPNIYPFFIRSSLVLWIR